MFKSTENQIAFNSDKKIVFYNMRKYTVDFSKKSTDVGIHVDLSKAERAHNWCWCFREKHQFFY